MKPHNLYCHIASNIDVKRPFKYKSHVPQDTGDKNAEGEKSW